MRRCSRWDERPLAPYSPSSFALPEDDDVEVVDLAHLIVDLKTRSSTGVPVELNFSRASAERRPKSAALWNYIPVCISSTLTPSGRRHSPGSRPPRLDRRWRLRGMMEAMALAVELYFDPDSDAAIRRAWKALDRQGVVSLGKLDPRPHPTSRSPRSMTSTSIVRRSRLRRYAQPRWSFDWAT